MASALRCPPMTPVHLVHTRCACHWSPLGRHEVLSAGSKVVTLLGSKTGGCLHTNYLVIGTMHPIVLFLALRRDIWPGNNRYTPVFGYSTGGSCHHLPSRRPIFQYLVFMLRPAPYQEGTDWPQGSQLLLALIVYSGRHFLTPMIGL